MNTEQPLPLLDDQLAIREIDTRNFLKIIDELPEQCETALDVGKNTVVKPFEDIFNSICITGVGDNAIAADIAAGFLSDNCEFPILINHGEKLPKSVGEKTLVFVIDYIGKSKSTMANYTEAIERKCTVYCLAGGGPLLKQAKQDGTRTVIIPPGQLLRTAIGYLFIPIICILENMGLASGALNKVISSILMLKNAREHLRVSFPIEKNIAKQAAEALVNKNIIIFGSSGYQEVICKRFEMQLLNTSNALASYVIFPDNNSHWGLLTSREEFKAETENLKVVFLRDKKDETEIPLMMDATRDLMEGVSYIDLDIKGPSVAEKTLYGIYLADYISFYIAILKGYNPSFTSVADELEEKIDSYQQIEELETEF